MHGRGGLLAVEGVSTHIQGVQWGMGAVADLFRPAWIRHTVQWRRWRTRSRSRRRARDDGESGKEADDEGEDGNEGTMTMGDMVTRIEREGPARALAAMWRPAIPTVLGLQPQDWKQFRGVLSHINGRVVLCERGPTLGAHMHLHLGEQLADGGIHHGPSRSAGLPMVALLAPRLSPAQPSHGDDDGEDRRRRVSGATGSSRRRHGGHVQLSDRRVLQLLRSPWAVAGCACPPTLSMTSPTSWVWHQVPSACDQVPPVCPPSARAASRRARWPLAAVRWPLFAVRCSLSVAAPGRRGLASPSIGRRSAQPVRRRRRSASRAASRARVFDTPARGQASEGERQRAAAR